jgi:2-polyprenyl-6-methoxyphenol hydroxylase-like FAD-dependent oxidoreductase
MFCETDISSKTDSHAVVIGGSMAGLLACRVLSDHFDRVTLIERDRFPEKPEFRKGVPQSHHSHIFLMRGRMILEEFFPGLQNELVADGASPVNLSKDLAWLNPVGWSVRFPSRLEMLSCSRNLLEWHVRRRLRQFSNVRFLEEGEVIGLLSNADSSQVAGARISLHNLPKLESKGEALLYADLVVDASGRSSKTPQWLTAIGYTTPQETKVNPFLGYASRIYKRPSEIPTEWKALYLQAAPPILTRSGVLLPIEGNCWMVSLYGLGKDYPPTDEAGFLDFVRSLRSPMLYDAIKNAEPISPIFGYHTSGNRLRHYERMSRWPQGLVVLGDAACTFNPVYGQGMTTAAMGAMVLNQCLVEQLWRDNTNLAQRFQKKLAQVIATPWMLATGEDFRVRQTEGGTPHGVIGLIHWYMNCVMQLATEDTKICLVLMEVMNMLKQPTALLQLSIVTQVLWQTFKSSIGWQSRDLQRALSDFYP